MRIKQILISIPASGSERPSRCKVWVNRNDGIDLNEVETVKPEMEFELLEGEMGAIEYPVKIVKFSSVSSVTLAFVSLLSSVVGMERCECGRIATQTSNDPSEAFKIWYIGFKGESRQYKRRFTFLLLPP